MVASGRCPRSRRFNLALRGDVMLVRLNDSLILGISHSRTRTDVRVRPMFCPAAIRGPSTAPSHREGCVNTFTQGEYASSFKLDEMKVVCVMKPLAKNNSDARCFGNVVSLDVGMFQEGCREVFPMNTGKTSTDEENKLELPRTLRSLLRRTGKLLTV